MKRARWVLAAILVGILLFAAALFPVRYLLLSRFHLGSGDEAALGLARLADVPLDGGATRFDYQAIDPERGLLFIAHLGADQVAVYDLKGQKVAGYITNVSSPHGVTIVPEMGRAYVSATGSRQVAVIDEETLSVVATVDAGQFPDGLAYDPGSHRLFVSDETGGGDDVIDIRSNAHVGRIDLGGEVGNTQYDAGSSQIVAAAQGRGHLALIDPVAQRVTGTIDLPGCRGPHGFAIDAPARRAYVSCEDNARLVVVDLDGRRALDGFDVGDVPDVLALDAGASRLYVASESGVVAEFVTGNGTLLPIAKSYLAPAAHTVAVDPSTHQLYFPLENVRGRAVLRILKPALGS